MMREEETKRVWPQPLTGLESKAIVLHNGEQRGRFRVMMMMMKNCPSGVALSKKPKVASVRTDIADGSGRSGVEHSAF